VWVLIVLSKNIKRFCSDRSNHC